jgi:hypothetical protein
MSAEFRGTKCYVGGGARGDGVWGHALDDLLLEHAKGKPIDLPSFGSGGYVQADDGKYRGETSPAQRRRDTSTAVPR